MNVAEWRMKWWMRGVTGSDIVWNEYVIGSLGLENMAE